MNDVVYNPTLNTDPEEEAKCFEAYLASREKEDWKDAMVDNCYIGWRDKSDLDSNFKLIVKRPSGKQDIYNLHKQNLRNGPCISGYFKKMLDEKRFAEAETGVCTMEFDEKRFAEAETGVCTMEFEDIVADVVPTVLDFIYSDGRVRCKVGHKNYLPIHFLDSYLLMSKSILASTEKPRPEPMFSCVGTYYKHAKILNQSWLIEEVLTQVASGIRSLRPENEFWELVNVDTIQKILEDDNLGTHNASFYSKNSLSYHISKVLARFIETKDVSAADFEILTHESKLPNIHPSVAKKLLELEESVAGVPKNYMTSLKKRCFNSTLKISRFIESHPDAADILNGPTDAAVDFVIRNFVNRPSYRISDSLDYYDSDSSPQEQGIPWPKWFSIPCDR